MIESIYQLLMKTSVKKWGNSVAVRIPGPFAKEMGLVNDTEVEIHMMKDHLVLSKPKSSLRELVSRISPDNLHAETDTGGFIGKEIW